MHAVRNRASRAVLLLSARAERAIRRRPVFYGTLVAIVCLDAMILRVLEVLVRA